MVCDEKKPCSRCVKRSIGHLCREDDGDQSGTRLPPINHTSTAQTVDNGTSGDDPEQLKVNLHSSPQQLRSQGHVQQSQQSHKQEQLDIQPVPAHLAHAIQQQQVSSNANRSANTSNNVNGSSLGRISSINQPLFLSEHIGSEFSSLNEFLTMLEDPMLIEPGTPLNDQIDGQSSEQHNQYRSGLSHLPHDSHPGVPTKSNSRTVGTITPHNVNMHVPNGDQPMVTAMSPPLLPDDQQPTPKENFFLTAADPSTEINPEDRLKLVINAKLEAGLLQPYNYAKGYSRLQNFMDKYMNQSSKQRILKPLSIIRPAFRAIARSLKDVDLVLVEESFERMLLSYDRVFTSMSMPACLWRRTGEIYRGNKEFASLVDCKVDDLRDGKLAIYELMSEESAVNFWEKYGSIAFDKGQKAVLTSCNLRTRDGRHRRPCCFSFTIRRDRYNIPICIVGNFIPIS